MTTPQQAIERLRQMQSQIIHGKNTFGEIADCMAVLDRIAATASALEMWLGKNTGTNAEWPVRIIAAEDVAEHLTTLLTDLKNALTPWRQP